jgi:hypothetical protein
MNHDDYPNESTLTWELRDALSAVAASERPPLAAITSRGRAHRRRLAGLAGLSFTGAAAGTVLTLSLTGVLGAAPARSTDATQATPPARSASAGTVRTAAFTLTSNANGTSTLTLTTGQMVDPAALQQALTQHDIPALVQTGTYCSSSPAAPDPASIGVLTVQLANGAPLPEKAPAVKTVVSAGTVTVINPAAIPSGTELFFGYSSSDRALFTDLVYTSSYTCSSTP